MVGLLYELLKIVRKLGLGLLGSIGLVHTLTDTAHQKIERSTIRNSDKKKDAVIGNREEFLAKLAILDLGNDCIIHIKTLDRHHKFIVLMYNGLVKELRSSSLNRSNPDEIFHRISVLSSAMSEHFIEEERFMAEHNYPGTLLHKRQHDLFLLSVAGLMSRAKTEDVKIEEAVFYIGSWLSEHILVADKYFGNFIQPAVEKNR